MIPYGHQDINGNDINEVIKILKSDFLTQGDMVPAFEKKVMDFTGAKYATSMNSATSALHAACLALGVGPGDLVWTSPISFVASSNCALYVGANVDFVDIDPKTYNISSLSLEDKLIKAKKENKLPKVVIPVHLAGQACDMEEIHKLSLEYGFKIIEDASHAIGAMYKGEPVGNSKYSDITIFSFHPVKIITTAEGGMALTNKSDLNEKLNLFKSHGITRDPKLMKNESHGPWYYEQINLGFNFRMTELQGALGYSQMDRLEEFVSKRHEVVSFYNEALKDLPLTLPYQNPETYSSFHLYIIRLNLDKINKTHEEVFNELREKGIGVNLHYIPIYKQPYYQNLGFSYEYCPNAEEYYKEAISIPMYSSLSRDQMNKVVSVLKEVLV